RPPRAAWPGEPGHATPGPDPSGRLTAPDQSRHSQEPGDLPKRRSVRQSALPGGKGMRQRTLLPAAVIIGLATLPALADDPGTKARRLQDRKSTRLNSSHEWISCAVVSVKNRQRVRNSW